MAPGGTGRGLPAGQSQQDKQPLCPGHSGRGLRGSSFNTYLTNDQGKNAHLRHQGFEATPACQHRRVRVRCARGETILC